MSRMFQPPTLITYCFAAALWLGSFAFVACAQDVQRVRPAEWAGLVDGGQFKDLLQPMPILGSLTRETWGGPNVLPRDIANGIEDPKWSYWGGNAILGEDGKYHLFVCRWAEDSPDGHFQYHDSEVVHTMADNSLGPFQVQSVIGPGHNPTVYPLADGRYAMYVVSRTHASNYIADHLNGPWVPGEYEFDRRDRPAMKRLVNFTFAQREDGSYLGTYRRGTIWFSKNGVSKWSLVSPQTVYPPVEGKFEDPVVWRDNVQYNLIVNDWLGRMAYHLRSKNGVHWVTEPGEAYAPGPGMSVYEDGTSNDWYKYERIRLLQDDHGRPTQAHFAVIDSDKHSDQPNDNHSSKQICIPLTVGRLLTVLSTDPITPQTDRIRVKVHAEDGFEPNTDIDLNSLRFGASSEVNFGRGCQLIETESVGKDLILVFDGKGNGFTEESFAGKLLGKTSVGNLLFGWSRLPGVTYIQPILSSRLVKTHVTGDGFVIEIEVQNFGQVVSREATVEVVVNVNGKEQLMASVVVPPTKPFDRTILRLPTTYHFAAGRKYSVTLRTGHEKQRPEILSTEVHFLQRP